MSGPGPFAGVMQSATGVVSGLISIPVLVGANAFFVAAEFALVSVRRTRVRELAQQGSAAARALESAVVNLDRSIAATQLGITVTSIGLGWLGEPALASILVPVFAWAGPELSGVAAHSLAFGVAFLAIAFLHVVLGELAPKTVALQIPDRVALVVAAPLLVFERVFRPFIWVLNVAGAAVVRSLGFTPAAGRAAQVHSVTELTMLVEASERAGVLERQEREMVHGALALGDMTARQVMVSRERMVAVRLDDPVDAIVQTALESGYSRLPVTDPATGDIQGILHAKDLLSLFAESEQGLVVIQDLLRPPVFVRGGTRLTDLLRHFQRGEMHLAFVQDEFGEVVGLVTLEDLLEEIVGEIRDEHDTAERWLKLERDGSFTAPGEAPARACLSDLGVTPPLWAGGALTDFLRRVRNAPLHAGDRVSFEDLVFAVLEDDGAGGARRVGIEKGHGPARRAPARD